MKTSTAIVVLAAGESKRLGRPKQLLLYRGNYLITHCIQQLMNLPGADVWVVLGAFAEEIAPLLTELPVRIVLNQDWKSGMGNSLAMGVKKAMELKEYDRIMITLGDLPLVGQKHYHSLLYHHRSASDIIITAYSDIQGVPVVFGSDYFSELLEISGDRGARSLLAPYKEKLIPVQCPFPYLDIDTEEAYAWLLKSEL